MALADAADSRYTLELVDDLRLSSPSKLLVRGEDDTSRISSALNLAGRPTTS